MKIRVWRLENPDGQGIFTSSWLLNRCGDNSITYKEFQSINQHPILAEDNIEEGFTFTHKFGFQSRELLFTWINRDLLKRLLKLGLKIKSFEVDTVKNNVIFGNYQCCFIPDIENN